MRKILMLAVLVSLMAFSANAASASDIALTSVGQSPDAMMVRVVLKNMKVQNDYNNLMKAEDLKDQKVLIAVVGGSSKGLGAAGINKEEEKERAIKLIEAAKQKGMKVLVMHVGGAGRRGQLSDMFIEAVVPYADAVIVVKGGNDDGLFTKLLEGKNVPMIEADSVKETVSPMKEVLSSWNVL
ncbi:hypothetical protein Tlie_1758 [Thermovirga lienii DSM 17291]|uniref:DUF6305 domain-containing protein n=1 Tax=Thermovirga lienii (strain ATCC BAA-1197 / DSM 17291 / Cas60314) TaxID=580340 RepID=G7V8L9_THELD|nr:DUF6305 family protein [Thermovirga lienii]AER67480.1 hypothetical protein Tlie_1758 [Thermovirga lienii DSM 17291]